jgi:serine/threonine-protein kinase
MRALPSATGSDVAIADLVEPLSSRPVFGRWRALEWLGRGGTAEVWRAVDVDGREGALKVLHPHLRSRAGAAELLRREHDVLARVASPHIVKPLDLVAGDVALVLEFLPGGDVVPLLGTAPGAWLAALESVVGALKDLRRAGLAHGDVKARNVLFAGDGSARLVDLTAARAVDSPAVVTTPAYRVPAPVTAGEADAYALAALLHELLTGRPPDGGDGPASPVARARDPVARALLAPALQVLRAHGRAPCGFSYLADVIESVEAARSQ